MRVAELRSILRYVPKFRGGVFVIGIDDPVLGSENFQNVLLDLAVLRSLNINVVLVYEPAPDTLAGSVGASARLLNHLLEGLSGVDLRAACANLVAASAIDGEQGYVNRVDARTLEFFLKEGIVPVIPVLGHDAEGRAYLLDSDEVIVAVAAALRALKVIFLTATRMPSHENGTLRNISVMEAETLLESGDERLNAAQRERLAAAVEACMAGVPRVHILPGEDDGAIMREVFSSEGIGTMVFSDDYQYIRPMEKRDIRPVLDLVRQSVTSAELVKRSRADFLGALGDFHVLETDGMIMGCVALHVHAELGLGELAFLYVRPNYGNRGYGRKLVQFVENLAVKRGLKAIFALSTQTFSFFEQKAGFTEVGPEILPPARLRKYEQSKRNSRVLIKNLPGAENALAMLPQDR
jgi:amino-acid N-acetyltransferase